MPDREQELPKMVVQRLSGFVQEQNQFNPLQLKDPVAAQTDWTPLARKSGAGFRTHKLVKVGAHRIEFRATRESRVVDIILLLFGIGMIILFSSLLFSCEDLGGIIFTIFILSMGVLIATVGGYLLYVSTVPIVFDRRRRFFWKGRKAPDEVVEKSSLAHFAPLEDIHALQLIPEYFRSPKGSFYSYELNLILNDGRRINVVDHGDQNKLREDAETLSGFLEKPVWDAIDDIIRLSNKAM